MVPAIGAAAAKNGRTVNGRRISPTARTGGPSRKRSGSLNTSRHRRHRAPHWSHIRYVKLPSGVVVPTFGGPWMRRSVRAKALSRLAQVNASPGAKQLVSHLAARSSSDAKPSYEHQEKIRDRHAAQLAPDPELLELK